MVTTQATIDSVIEQDKPTGNGYESLRPDIVKLVMATVVKVANDGSRTAYNWSIGKVFGEAEKAFVSMLLNGKLPPLLKEMVRFEFNKLKMAVMNNDGWEHKRTTVGYALTPDQIEYRRQDSFSKRDISLAEQEKGCQVLLDKVGKAMANASCQEVTDKLNKRARRLHKELLSIREEMMLQSQLLASTMEKDKAASKNK